MPSSRFFQVFKEQPPRELLNEMIDLRLNRDRIEIFNQTLKNKLRPYYLPCKMYFIDNVIKDYDFRRVLRHLLRCYQLKLVPYQKYKDKKKSYIYYVVDPTMINKISIKHESSLISFK